MTANRFQGDPKITIDQDGANIEFKAGQPVMDMGFHNQATISLFTSPGWWGNDLFDDTAQQIGSDFERRSRGTITLSKLSDIRQTGINALRYEAFGQIDGEVMNPISSKINAKFTVKPQGQDVNELLVSTYGQNWINQAEQGD